MSEKYSEDQLAAVPEEHHNLDFRWRLNLASHLWTVLKKYYQTIRKPPLPEFPDFLPRRLLWHSARRIPLAATTRDLYLGPSVVLPNGNVAIFCFDCFLRILDTGTGVFCCEKRFVVGNSAAELRRAIGDHCRLFYSKVSDESPRKRVKVSDESPHKEFLVLELFQKVATFVIEQDGQGRRRIFTSSTPWNYKREAM